MLQKSEVNGVHLEVDKKLHDYTSKKIGGLDKYVPKHARVSAHCEVHLKDLKTKNSRYSCMATLFLPHQSLFAHEKADSIEAAIDLTETALKVQLKKYKELHAGGKAQRHLIARLLKGSTR